MPRPEFGPCYSHGGPTTPGYPAVAGNGTSSGLPVFIGDHNPNAPFLPTMVIFCAGGNATVILEANGGIPDLATGQPPAAEWVDCSNGGFAMTAGSTLAKSIPPSLPCWRTRITVNAGATVVSYVPNIAGAGTLVPASHPSVSSVQSLS
jgi:hypothetical protein